MDIQYLDRYSVNLLVLALQLRVHVDRHVPEVRQDPTHLHGNLYQKVTQKQLRMHGVKSII